MQTISIVTPAYNEEENVRPMYEAVKAVFTGELDAYEFELIFVDDGSSDGTVQQVNDLRSGDKRIGLVSLTRNFGHQAALMAGIRYASGDAIITMDCDLQHPPSTIPALIREWKTGYKVVYGRRAETHTSAFKRVTSRLYYSLLDHTSDVSMPRNVGDFRLIARDVQHQILQLTETSLYLRGLIAWLGYKSAFVEYDEPARVYGGKSRYSLIKMLRLAMSGMLNFSLFPLRLGLWLGIFIVLTAACFLAWICYQHFIAGVFYQLYKWITVLTFGFVGMQFIIMWILGEYVGRIHNAARGRPQFIVDSEYGSPQRAREASAPTAGDEGASE
jgi:polyisoprenyl-phosphate glycosyltransferase